MAAPSEEKLICDKFNLEALTVNQVKSFKALADGKDVFIGTPNNVSAKDFLAFPSPQKLKQMGRQKAQNLLDELGTDINNIDKVVQTFLRISSIVTLDDEDTKESVCECADKLIEESLKSDSNTGSMLTNSLLVSIGILKGEDKKYKAPSTITGPLLVLEHVVKQPYFPKLSREMLSMFMSKPHPLLEKSRDARHKLLQTLMAY